MSVIREVRTCPCPRCRSWNTQSSLRRGVVVLRGCRDCLWTWDHYDGASPGYADDYVNDRGRTAPRGQGAKNFLP
jgi:hypothetical protein